LTAVNMIIRVNHVTMFTPAHYEKITKFSYQIKKEIIDIDNSLILCYNLSKRSFLAPQADIAGSLLVYII
jgi:hypothetical protein